MEPEEVVRAFLEAESRFEAVAPFTVGPVELLVRIADRYNESLAVAPEQHALNIRRLRVRTNDGKRAVVDVDAFVLAHVGTRFGAHTQRHRFRGPISLIHADGEWKVDGYTVDGVPAPRGNYEPLVDVTREGVALAVGAQLSKNGSVVFAEVTNVRAEPLVVDELTLEFSPLGIFTSRWGAVHVPAVLAPGERWADIVGWGGLWVRRSLTVVVRAAGVDHRFVLEPPRGVGPVRRRLRPLYGIEGFLYLAFALGALSSALTGTIGLLGLAAFPGIYAAARAARAYIAGFPSSWATAQGMLGAAEIALGTVAMLRSGFGWIGTFALVGTMAFALQQSVAQAHRVRAERIGRLRQVATMSNAAAAGPERATAEPVAPPSRGEGRRV